MRHIALSFTNTALIERLQHLFPQADILYLTLEQVQRSASKQQLSGLLVDEHTLRDGGVTRLETLKSRFPELAIIMLLPTALALPHRLLELGQAYVGCADSGFRGPSRAHP